MATVERVSFDWMRKPTPIPCARVIKVFVDPKNVGRGVNLKEIILYGTPHTTLASVGPRRVLAFRMTIQRLVDDGLLTFAKAIDRYFLDKEVNVVAVRAHITAAEKARREEHDESLTEDLEGVGYGG